MTWPGTFDLNSVSWPIILTALDIRDMMTSTPYSVCIAKKEYVLLCIVVYVCNHRFPRPVADSSTGLGLIPGGRRMPNAAAGDRAAKLLRFVISTLALARPIAGTTQLPQLHCMPCQANLPMFCPQLALGHVRRPDNGASSGREPYSEPEDSVVLGNKHGRIHVRGCKKTWAHSIPTCALARFSDSCGMMNGVVANIRLLSFSIHGTTEQKSRDKSVPAFATSDFC